MTTTSRGTSSSVVQATNGASGLMRSSPVRSPVTSAPSCVAQPLVDLLGHQPERPAVRAGPGARQDLERGVRLAGVGRPQVGHDALPLGDRGEHRAQRRGHGLPLAGIDALLERMRTRQPLRPDRSTLGDDMTPASLPAGRLAHPVNARWSANADGRAVGSVNGASIPR